MKLRVIGMMAFLIAGNVAAEEVQLVCFGSDTLRGEDGSYESVDATRQVRFDEEAGTFAYTASGKGFKDAKSVKFTEQYITAKYSGSWGSWGLPAKIELDRYSGILKSSAAMNNTLTLQCEVVEQEKRF